MAQRMRYIGSFHDASYGIDRDGELFASILDAENALRARHRDGHWRTSPVYRLNGVEEHVLFPAVTNEAYLLLWKLDIHDQFSLREYAELHQLGDSVTRAVSGYMRADADAVVWIGARQAARHGSYADFADQRDRRTVAEVRLAGSVVVDL